LLNDLIIQYRKHLAEIKNLELDFLILKSSLKTESSSVRERIKQQIDFYHMRNNFYHRQVFRSYYLFQQQGLQKGELDKIDLIVEKLKQQKEEIISIKRASF